MCKNQEEKREGEEVVGVKLEICWPYVSKGMKGRCDY
jgi:hypothetical protein